MDQMKEKNLTFNADMDIKHRYIYADMLKINEISMNLLSNAIKYTRVGNVELTVDFKEIDDNNINLIFVVKDTGIGIAPENIDKILEDNKVKYRIRTLNSTAGRKECIYELKLKKVAKDELVEKIMISCQVNSANLVVETGELVG